MTAMSWLAFAAVVALYLRWNYTSPFVGKAELDSDSFLKRSIPLMLFIASGLLATASLSVSDRALANVLLAASACFLIAAPIVTYVHRRRRR